MVFIDVRLVDLQATLLDMKTSYLTTNWCQDLVARTFQSKHFSFLREDSKNHCVELPLPPLFSICKWDIEGLFTFLATHLEGMFHFQHINFECQMHHKHWKKSTKWDLVLFFGKILYVFNTLVVLKLFCHKMVSIDNWDQLGPCNTKW